MKSFSLLFWVGLLSVHGFAASGKDIKTALERYVAEVYPEHRLAGVEELEGDVIRVSLFDKIRGRTLKVRLRAVESKAGQGIRFELKRSCGHVIEDILQTTKKSI